MSVENLPSGRERAIEMLIDMEPQGPFYRASRVLEESVPQALLSRPNLITKSALVEQTYALAKYEIDEVEKYDAVHGEAKTPPLAGRLRQFDKQKKERIIRHHAKILATKRGGGGSKVKSSGLTPQLVAALRQVYGESESLELWSLLQSVMEHVAFKEEDGPEKKPADDSRNAGSHQVEALIANLVYAESDTARLHGLLITMLSMVTSYEIKDVTDSEAKEQLVPSNPAPLQVGSLLSILSTKEQDNKNSWELDEELLSYLGEAAAVYEERIEIQKEQLLAKLDSSTAVKDIVKGDKKPYVTRAGPTDDSPVVGGSPEDSPHLAASPDDETENNIHNYHDNIEAAAAALSAAVFESMISNNPRDEESSEDGDESSDSGSQHGVDEEEDDDDSGHDELENGSSSASSSSSSSEAEMATGDQEQFNLHGDIEDADIEEQAVLREALAISLSDQSQTLHVDTAMSGSEEETMISRMLSPGPITPGSETPISKRGSSPVAEVVEDNELPSIPKAPISYPYSHLFDAKIDSDQVETDSQFFDPCALTRFGTLPAPHVLMHLLRVTAECIERRKFSELCSVSSMREKNVIISTVPGGMGSSLFCQKPQFKHSDSAAKESRNDIAVSLQMLASLFLLIEERRTEANSKLKSALQQENRALDTETSDSNDGDAPDAEGDDPAIALALHYVDDETETKESLEAKGMHRKAAAAAHDAAAVQASLKRRRKAWEQQVEFFSYFSFWSMNCLQTYLQSIVRRWLRDPDCISLADCGDLLPKTLSSKVLAYLESIFSPSPSYFPTTETQTGIISCKNYQSAVRLWGELVPVVYPSPASMKKILAELLELCSNPEPGKSYVTFEKLSSLPSTDIESAFHKVQVLCRRLRVSDFLDCLVSGPVCFISEIAGNELTGPTVEQSESLPEQASALAALLGSSLKNFASSVEFQNFYFALCHKCHVRMLLWDGFYASADTDNEEGPMSLTAPSADTVRVAMDPTDSLLFDNTKCSDSMSIVPNKDGSVNGSSANQRASKVWGTVLSSTSFTPKTGVHRWAVRLDKCERGHVFIGVSTAQASTRTYVGGDKYGWGMIGTQALWHDRKKVRGDYGSTFRTGSTIIVTLDTDAGTLSFSTWKEAPSSNAYSVDSVLQNPGWTRRQGHISGTAEDWGVAFEGLPLDSRLFPAVGLYQRDDKVTLLSVLSGHAIPGKEGALDLTGGLCYYPRIVGDESGLPLSKMESARKFNSNLSWDGLVYTARVLQDVIRDIKQGTNSMQHSIASLLPSLASSLCLIPPTIPVLSQRCAMILLPLIAECISELDKIKTEDLERDVFSEGLREGKWAIRATGSSNSYSDSEEYIVDIVPTVNADGSKIGFEGRGVGTTGKSTNGLVTVFGDVTGSAVHFVEEWSDGNNEVFGNLTQEENASSCVASARLSLDGTKFEGNYRNVQFGTIGRIAGVLQVDDRKVTMMRLKDAPQRTNVVEAGQEIFVGKSLLCLAHGHLASFLTEDSADDYSFAPPCPHTLDLDDVQWKSRYSNLRGCLSLPTLSNACLGSGDSFLKELIQGVLSSHEPPENVSATLGQVGFLSEDIFSEAVVFHGEKSARSKPANFIDDLKNAELHFSVPGNSLSGLCKDEYNNAKYHLIGALLCLARLHCTHLVTDGKLDDLKAIWNGAQQILDRGVRASLASSGNTLPVIEKARATCRLYKEVSRFLLGLEFADDFAFPIDTAIRNLGDIVSAVGSVEEVRVLEEEMKRSTQRGILRVLSSYSTLSLLKLCAKPGKMVVTEFLSVGIPRILGRGRSSLFSSPGHYGVKGADRIALDGHYLACLPGASSTVKYSFKYLVHELWATLDQALGITVKGQNGLDAPVDSMTLAVLSTFAASMSQEDIAFVVLKTNVLALIKRVFDVHREAAMECKVVENSGLLSVGNALVEQLYEVGCRELSRSVVRALLGVCHLLLYQAMTVDSDTSNAAVLPLLEFMMQELRSTSALVQDEMLFVSNEFKNDLGKSQWERWLETTIEDKVKTPRSRPNDKPRAAMKSGLAYLLENGLSQVSMTPSTQSRLQSQTRSAQNTDSSNGKVKPSLPQSRFSHYILTNWLHLLLAASKLQAGQRCISSNKNWTSTLVTMASGHENRTLPALPPRYKARLLRLLLPLIESQPLQSFVNCLFDLAGRSTSISSTAFDLDESETSREAVTLLRKLYSPERESWRRMMDEVIISICSEPAKEVGDSIYRKMGVALFFNGVIESIALGSFVLLKPAAATPLSSEQQSSSSSKNHPSSSGGGGYNNTTPHHVLGNGTEGIVSGLCRKSANAGIVSSVDTRNGFCEIILLNRDVTGDDGSQAIRKKLSTSAGIGRTSATRYTLTVRAVRSPLSDLALAQEIGLDLGQSPVIPAAFANLINEALELQTKHDADAREEKASGLERLAVKETLLASLEAAFSAKILKAAISAFSDKEVLKSFLQDPANQKILPKLLRLAYTTVHPNVREGDNGTACHAFLSWLPTHEARWKHLVLMFRDLRLRKISAEFVGDETWEKRFDDYRQLAEPKAAKVPTESSSGHLDGYLTPPCESVQAPSIHPILSGTTRSQALRGNDENESTRQTEAGGRSASQSTASNDNSEEDDDSEAAATAAAHLREAAIAQMAELGLPRRWSELALRRTGGTSIEAAVHFCLERGGEMEALLLEESERERAAQRSASGSGRRRGIRGANSSHLLSQLTEMGFPSRWCAEALAATGNNVDEALTWILTNGERLSAEDAGMDDVDDDEEFNGDDEEDEDEESQGDEQVTATEHESVVVTNNDNIPDIESDKISNSPDTPAWQGSVTPLRFISGRSIIDSKTLSISGLPTGGFSSVGTKGVLLTSGQWYYEAILETAGCLQIGWADGSFAGHCHADRGDGCGDGPSSWAFDGWRRYRWHATATEWGCRWKEGDVIGCMVDMDAKSVSFTLNGKGEEIGMGLAFSGTGFRPCGGVYACVSFNRREKLRIILGGRGSKPFQYSPPAGYKGVGEAVLAAVEEREALVAKEKILDLETVDRSTDDGDSNKRFLCDFSDGNHGHELMAWAHRYYGSDASVHLGSSRSKSATLQNSTGLPSSATQDLSIGQFLNHRIEKAWRKSASDLSDAAMAGRVELVDLFSQGYEVVTSQILDELLQECTTLSSLYSRKLVLHIMVALGEDFNPDVFMDSEPSRHLAALKFWRVVESSAGLASVGWVGEAGAMAVAAEALGLGISSNETLGSRNAAASRASLLSQFDVDSSFPLPCAGVVQVLTSVQHQNGEDDSLNESAQVASAEASIGSDGGGAVLIFLRRSLQGALCHSSEFREVVLAYARRTVRLLAVVEYDGEDSSKLSNIGEDDTMEGQNISKASLESVASSFQIDARLVSYLTGLLLSPAVEQGVADHASVKVSLFESWSTGMLSASLPWRMVCAFTASGILNTYPPALKSIFVYPTLCRYYGRILSTVSRRAWAERAASPVCSRYMQAMIELLCSVRRSVEMIDVPDDFLRYWKTAAVDAATPLPLSALLDSPGLETSNWEAVDGFLSSNNGFETWTGTVHFHAVDWKAPSRSAVRTLMDGGDGPPMLREGCTVMRGVDWSSNPSANTEDGKDMYEREKAKRNAEKNALETEEKDAVSLGTTDGILHLHEGEKLAPSASAQKTKKPKGKKRISSPKLPLGTVLSIEDWDGVPAMARRVRWHLTGEEGIYRYGGDGGRYDISHVEVNDKSTRVKKRHPLPESNEQCVARHGFGTERHCSVLLRICKTGIATSSKGGPLIRRGILEWPDFGSGILVDCTYHEDSSFTVIEKGLVYGSADSGWEARFGQPCFVPGTTFWLAPSTSSDIKNQAEIDSQAPFGSMYDELLGSSTYEVPGLRNRDNGGRICVTSELRLYRDRTCNEHIVGPESIGNQAPLPPPLSFDRNFHASSLSLSKDGRTVSCTSSEGRGTAFASMGFTKGLHYWEVKLEQADIGSVFVGVAEKPNGDGSGLGSWEDTSAHKLNRWHGWGFVNFRATYTAGAERIYGAHCHAGDTVGVLLDCDAGRLSFFFDGLKYGEHILNDLGCAFENLSPFGFNVDGCGSGGAGQGAPGAVDGLRSGRFPAQGAVRPKALWPVIGLRNQGDRVTISAKWSSSYGTDGVATVQNAVAVDEILDSYTRSSDSNPFPDWFVKEAYSEFRRWRSGSWCRTVTRGSGPLEPANCSLNIQLNCSPLACACASALLGLKEALLPGDRVRLTRSAGRVLELAEEAVVLGTHQGRLYYQIVSQKSEGGSLTEGGGRAWFWDESEVVDGLIPISKPKGLGIPLPMMDRFRCLAPGGLKVVYERGAVIRSDLEIFEGSLNLGSIPANTVITKKNVVERRINSCGVIRYRVRYEGLEGWISSRIRGGMEEAIVAPVMECEEASTSGDLQSFRTPLDCAVLWLKAHQQKQDSTQVAKESSVDLETFRKLLSKGVLAGKNMAESDAFLVNAIGQICDLCEGGNPLDVNFEELAEALGYALASNSGKTICDLRGKVATNQVAATAFSTTECLLPELDSIFARVALLRAFNRRARIALPWLSLKPSQEGSAMFGGVYGHGTSIDRAGRSVNQRLLNSWVQIPSIGSKVRALRGIFFTSVKREFIRNVTDATTTPTPLSHDEYELPREIRTVRLNRLKARRVMASDDKGAKKKHSVFAQLQNETKSWSGAALRRGFVAKGHGGQKRAFKVKLIGEGVNDYSGPYREAFTDALAEVLSVSGEAGSLGVLDPTPNGSAEVGENRGLFMFSLNGVDISKMFKHAIPSMSSEEEELRESFSSLIFTRNEATREVEEALVFLGRITGTAFRHGIPLELPLPLESVWKAIVEEPSTFSQRLEELDVMAHRFSKDGGPHPLIMWQQRMLNAFCEGLSNVLPVEIFTILTGEELRDAICGNPDVDVDLLKQVVEYEGFQESDELVQFFWETLREFSNDERKAFLQFVWARNRLPMKESDFEAPFKLQKDSSKTSGELALPSASTCFFSLSLPQYKSKAQLKEKLLFAIRNVTTMETDFQTNSAEIAEGYRF